MTSITIRNLDDETVRQLRRRAADNGRSIEEEARHILHQAVSRSPSPANLGEAIHRRFAAVGGIDLDVPPRETPHE